MKHIVASVIVVVVALGLGAGIRSVSAQMIDIDEGGGLPLSAFEPCPPSQQTNLGGGDRDEDKQDPVVVISPADPTQQDPVITDDTSDDDNSDTGNHGEDQPKNRHHNRVHLGNYKNNGGGNYSEGYCDLTKKGNGNCQDE